MFKNSKRILYFILAFYSINFYLPLLSFADSPEKFSKLRERDVIVGELFGRVDPDDLDQLMQTNYYPTFSKNKNIDDKVSMLEVRVLLGKQVQIKIRKHIQKEQQTWHTRGTQKPSNFKTKKGSVIRKDQQRWSTEDEADATTTVDWEWEGRGRSPSWSERAGTCPNSPGGVGAEAPDTSLDTPMLGPDWSKTGLNEYQRSVVNKQIVVSRKHLAKNTRAEQRRRQKEQNTQKQKPWEAEGLTQFPRILKYVIIFPPKGAPNCWA